MELTLELIADVCIDLGMAIFLWNLVAKKGQNVPFPRLISATFTVGFIMGTIAAAISGSVAFVVLDVIGFILSGAALLFCLFGRSEANNK